MRNTLPLLSSDTLGNYTIYTFDADEGAGRAIYVKNHFKGTLSVEELQKETIEQLMPLDHMWDLAEQSFGVGNVYPDNFYRYIGETDSPTYVLQTATGHDTFTAFTMTTLSDASQNIFTVLGYSAMARHASDRLREYESWIIETEHLTNTGRTLRAESSPAPFSFLSSAMRVAAQRISNKMFTQYHYGNDQGTSYRKYFSVEEAIALLEETLVYAKETLVGANIEATPENIVNFITLHEFSMSPVFHWACDNLSYLWHAGHRVDNIIRLIGLGVTFQHLLALYAFDTLRPSEDDMKALTSVPFSWFLKTVTITAPSEAENFAQLVAKNASLNLLKK